MKRFSQTLKVMLALFVAIFSNGLLPATAAYADSPNPPGNNGTVKIKDNDTDITKANQPMLSGCSVTIQWWGFDAGARTASVEFVGQGTTDTSQIVSPQGAQQEAFTGSGAGDQLDYSKTYVLSFSGAAGPQGYQVKVNIDTDKSKGSDKKSKVFWVSSDCRVPDSVDVAKAIVDDSCGKGNDSFTVPVTEHVSYTYRIGNGPEQQVTEGSPIPATAWGQVYTVTATADTGYVLSGSATQTFEFTNKPCTMPSGTIGDVVCKKDGGDVKVTFANDSTAEESATFTVELSGNVVYTKSLAPGTNESYIISDLKNGKYHVVIKADGTEVASKDITVDCFKQITVTPKAPKFIDFCGDRADYVYIPYVKGVVYKLGNDIVRPGYHKVTADSITITAMPKDSHYTFPEEVKTSWSYTFEDAQCITITKKFASYTDTNNDGVVSVGDTLTWDITVTNNSKNMLDNFKVVLKDSTAELDQDGTIEHFKPGDVAQFTATSTITPDDMKACQATNTVSFSAWYNYRDHTIDRDGRSDEFSSLLNYDHNADLSDSASDIFPFTCPTPGSGGGGEETPTTTETPATLPATGPADSSNPLLVLAAAAVAYGATYFIQRRRETASN